MTRCLKARIKNSARDLKICRSYLEPRDGMVEMCMAKSRFRKYSIS